MKLLLTSAGISNKSIEQALQSLSDKPLKNLNCAFVPTASHWESGDKYWLIEDLNKCQELFKTVDIVDFAALPQERLMARLNAADILFVEGGNTWFLMKSIRESGLVQSIDKLLEDKIYVGASAGSMVVTQDLFLSNSKLLYDEEIVEYEESLKLVDFCILPHYNNSVHFPNVIDSNLTKLAKETGQTIYALDDDSAIKVVDGDIEVISEGTWKKF